MYKSEYLTVRVVDPRDAEGYQPTETIDQLLWLLDVYDLKEVVSVVRTNFLCRIITLCIRVFLDVCRVGQRRCWHG